MPPDSRGGSTGTIDARGPRRRKTRECRNRCVPARPDGRRYRAARPRLSSEHSREYRGSSLHQLSFDGQGRAATVARDARLVPQSASRAPRATLDVLHCTTMRAPVRARPRRRDGARRRSPPAPGGVPALASAHRPTCSSPGRADRRCDLTVSAFTRDELAETLASFGDRVRSSATASTRSSLDRSAAAGDYVLAVARSSPARTSRGRSRPRGVPRSSPCGRSRRMGRSGRSRLGWPGGRRGPRRPVPRRTLLRLPVVLRGLRDPDARGDGLWHAGRDEPRRRHRGGRRRRRCAGRCARRRRDRLWHRGGGDAARGARTTRIRTVTSVHLASAPRMRSMLCGGSSRERRRSWSWTPTCSAADAPGTRRMSATCFASSRRPRKLRACRIAAVTRRPDLVPAGVDAIELSTASQVARMAWALPRLLSGSVPISCTRSTRFRCDARAPLS